MSTLNLEDYRRYGRQMILNEVGLQGQEKLLAASVCVVGAGGLGCPAIQYLAAAGVGRIGIIDDDTVDLSNLQRQILHTESKVGISKAHSAASSVKDMNSRVCVDVHCQRLAPENAREILGEYDVILDCTDNAPARYLLSDTCVVLEKPLVSGAALQFDGQLCVYNLRGGPCYRCLFPRPPAPEVMGTCEERGVLGPVTGVIGTLQAMEAIKIIAGLDQNPPSLLIYSALSMPPFRSIKLRKKKPDCLACGEDNGKGVLIDQADYVEVCGSLPPDYEALGYTRGVDGHRVTAKEFSSLPNRSSYHIIDVRPKVEYGICHLPHSKNVPLSQLVANPQEHLPPNSGNVLVVCRLGNDSRTAAGALREYAPSITVQDLVGGLRAWSKDVDPSFPVY